MKKIIMIVVVLAGFLVFGTTCLDFEKGPMIFVSTKMPSDTLTLNISGSYLRNFDTSVDSGSWRIQKDRLWLGGWVGRGEVSTYYGAEQGEVAFSFSRCFSVGKINKVFFDVDNYYFYKRIR